VALEAFSRVLPVLLLFGLGMLIRRRGLMGRGTIDDLRRLILGITLPAALFAALYGSAVLYRFAMVDIGQVLFVFFILATVVMVRASGRRPPLGETVAAFVRNPVILAILAGIGGSVVGLGEALDSHPLGVFPADHDRDAGGTHHPAHRHRARLLHVTAHGRAA